VEESYAIVIAMGFFGLVYFFYWLNDKLTDFSHIVSDWNWEYKEKKGIPRNNLEGRLSDEWLKETRYDFLEQLLLGISFIVWFFLFVSLISGFYYIYLAIPEGTL
jgi:hypothetical protein